MFRRNKKNSKTTVQFPSLLREETDEYGVERKVSHTKEFDNITQLYEDGVVVGSNKKKSRLANCLNCSKSAANVTAGTFSGCMYGGAVGGVVSGGASLFTEVYNGRRNNLKNQINNSTIQNYINHVRTAELTDHVMRNDNMQLALFVQQHTMINAIMKKNEVSDRKATYRHQHLVTHLNTMSGHIVTELVDLKTNQSNHSEQVIAAFQQLRGQNEQLVAEVGKLNDKINTLNGNVNKCDQNINNLRRAHNNNENRGVWGSVKHRVQKTINGNSFMSLKRMSTMENADVNINTTVNIPTNPHDERRFNIPDMNHTIKITSAKTIQRNFRAYNFNKKLRPYRNIYKLHIMAYREHKRNEEEKKEEKKEEDYEEEEEETPVRTRKRGWFSWMRR